MTIERFCADRDGKVPLKGQRSKFLRSLSPKGSAGTSVPLVQFQFPNLGRSARNSDHGSPILPIIPANCIVVDARGDFVKVALDVDEALALRLGHREEGVRHDDRGHRGVAGEGAVETAEFRSMDGSGVGILWGIHLR